MSTSPYSNLPRKSFWRPAVAQQDPRTMHDIFTHSYEIKEDTKIATAGSCFAQHITASLKKRNYTIIDVEPAPKGMKAKFRSQHGYEMYSARYGNIYTTRQLLQLFKEIANQFIPPSNIYVWPHRNGHFIDGFRPAVEPIGLPDSSEVIEQREQHIKRVRSMIEEMDLFIFTLGLTETWRHKESGIVFPTAPGVIAGESSEDGYEMLNLTFQNCVDDFKEVMELTQLIRAGKQCHYLLTVSPVPLTATASDQHILVASTHSKAILRGVAGELSQSECISYFPSYELVTNPARRSNGYEENLRTVRKEIVDEVMEYFFLWQQTSSINATHQKEEAPQKTKPKRQKKRKNHIQCEEEFNDPSQNQ